MYYAAVYIFQFMLKRKVAVLNKLCYELQIKTSNITSTYSTIANFIKEIP